MWGFFLGLLAFAMAIVIFFLGMCAGYALKEAAIKRQKEISNG